MIDSYSTDELMTVLMARELHNGDLAVTGATSLVPVAACLLAQQLHAPDLTLIMPSGLVNPRPGRLYRSASDGRWVKCAEAVGTGYDLFEMSENGRLDVMFYGGIQIDKHGNINLTKTGLSQGSPPKFRGPGLANTSFAVVSKRIILFSRSHTSRTFVEEVDFVTASGHLSGGSSRAESGITTEGPVVCITPLATFSFDETKAMQVRSIHPGVNPEDVANNTGFNLRQGNWDTTRAPTVNELTTLRQCVDTTGELR
ncbi:CoA-transferase subunit beta [Rhodococcus sp. NPDC019627]|uniref:Putative CoA-transferase beta subunit n=1 Tax=Rhodococcus opacus (strain B4) TaxID=632772 RepID=C1BDV7_RHOOB|nr:CoA-transferase [Rhodococcus opacus]BAH47160.1 putative CoA-transferase beta subunit [Rhodococcus opacus B4]